MNKEMNMNTNDIWIALATFGRARISYETVTRQTEQYVRNQLNSEADREGVSLRINTIVKGVSFGDLDVSLRKFA
jgi:hypothetical protein